MDWTKREVKQKFYHSKEWHILRSFILQRQPICEICIEKDRLTPATEVHHKIDIELDPGKRLDPNNLQPLCQSCHANITLNADNEKKFTPLNKVWNVEPLKIKKPK